MDALTGSWIAGQIASYVMPGIIEAQFAAKGVALPSQRKEISEKDFRNIQAHCLMACRFYKEVGGQQVAEQVLADTGQWVLKSLECDTLTVMALTFHALQFNIAPFFDESALEPIAQSFGLNLKDLKGSSLFGALTSMNSPSGQS